jgi:phenylalanyl-tRNA synthetase alpha subunit
MPSFQIVAGKVIVFSKVGIGNLSAEFLNSIHLSYSKDTRFRVFLLDIELHLSTLQSAWLFRWFPIRPPSFQVVVDWKAFFFELLGFGLADDG